MHAGDGNGTNASSPASTRQPGHTTNLVSVQVTGQGTPA